MFYFGKDAQLVRPLRVDIMNPDKYYWTNRASIHHIEKLLSFLPKGSDPKKILLSGSPRYIENIEEQVTSADGHRRYDLLIEYDIYHPSHGIYFGCRSTTLPGYDHASECINALKEWNAVLPLALRRLNNVFPEKDFSCRLRETDNANNRTFWPFWISLYEDESPDDVACVALWILAGAYCDYVMEKGPEVEMPERNVIEYAPVKTAFTIEAYDTFINRLSASVAAVSSYNSREENIRMAIELFESMLRGLEEKGIARRNEAYESAWCLNESVSDIEFSALIKTFFNYLTLLFGCGSSVKVPWLHIIRIFLRHDETPFKEQVKTLKAQRDTIDKMSSLISEICSLDEGT